MSAPEVLVPAGTTTPRQELMSRFESHELSDDATDAVAATRAKVKTLANHINKKVPDSREKSLALTHLELVSFWANAATARNQDQP